jgi:hypothetical protein
MTTTVTPSPTKLAQAPAPLDDIVALTEPARTVHVDELPPDFVKDFKLGLSD